jgi:hypothetical protein
VRSSLLTIPFGDGGIASTLDVMVRVARDGAKLPGMILFAQDVVRGIPARETDREASAIFDAVRGAFRYTRDPVPTELVKSPEVMLRELEEKGVIAGDCDDYIVFLLAAMMAVGIEAEPMVISEDRGTYSHVLARYRGKRGWVSLDPITNNPVGWAPTFASRAAVYSGGSLHGIPPRSMGTTAVAAPRARIQPAVALTTRAPVPYAAAPFPALAGSVERNDPAARLSATLANYTDLIWWAGAAIYAASIVKKWSRR